MIVRHELLPAASNARIVMAFDPIKTGTVALQLLVPAAMPDAPKLFAQVTLATPTLSPAVPLITIDASVVENVLEAGEVMAIDGGVVSDGLGGGVGTTILDRRVTVIGFETCAVPAVAVMVMVFAPIASGTFEIFHADAGPAAVPEAPPMDHVTTIATDPPAAEPEKFIEDAVVVDGGAATVNVSGIAGVVGFVGGGGVASCAAYNVSAAALSPAASVVTIL